MQDLPEWIPLATSAINLATALAGWVASHRRRTASRPYKGTAKRMIS